MTPNRAMYGYIIPTDTGRDYRQGFLEIGVGAATAAKFIITQLSRESTGQLFALLLRCPCKTLTPRPSGGSEGYTK